MCLLFFPVEIPCSQVIRDFEAEYYIAAWASELGVLVTVELLSLRLNKELNIFKRPTLGLKLSCAFCPAKAQQGHANRSEMFQAERKASIMSHLTLVVIRSPSPAAPLLTTPMTYMI